jgi:hypothetical protein
VVKLEVVRDVDESAKTDATTKTDEAA